LAILAFWEWYQITLGGEQGNNAAIGKVIGPSFYADEIPNVMSSIIDTYVGQRSEDESFIETYRRLGMSPFKEAAYKNARAKAAQQDTAEALSS
jgi:sulfite reductase (NADPH) hemoprotein beta-component